MIQYHKGLCTLGWQSPQCSRDSLPVSFCEYVFDSISSGFLGVAEDAARRKPGFLAVTLATYWLKDHDLQYFRINCSRANTSEFRICLIIHSRRRHRTTAVARRFAASLELFNARPTCRRTAFAERNASPKRQTHAAQTPRDGTSHQGIIFAAPPEASGNRNKTDACPPRITHQQSAARILADLRFDDTQLCAGRSCPWP